MKKIMMLIFLTLALTGCSDDEDGNDLFESWGNPSTKTVTNSEGTFTRIQYCRIYNSGDGKCIAKDFDASLLTEMKIKNASFYSYEHGTKIVGNDTYRYTGGDMSLGNRDEQISLVYNTSSVGKDRLKGSFVEFKSLENNGTHFLKAGNILKDSNTSVLKERHGVEITYDTTGNTAVENIVKIELLDNLVVKRVCTPQGIDFECTEPSSSVVKNKVDKQKIKDIVPVFPAPTDKNNRIYKTDITYKILEAFNFQNFT